MEWFVTMRLTGDQFESLLRNLSNPEDPVEWIAIDGLSGGRLSAEYQLTDGERGAFVLGPTGEILDLSIRL